MAWTSATVQAQNLVSTICTNLVAGGWTEEDAVNKVYSSTNNQGVKQYLQVSQVGTYTYIQLQGWRVWTGGAGTNGTDNTYNRLYLNSAAVGATTPTTLMMSVTSNRVIISIDSYMYMYRSWGYFGGFETTLCGTTDPGAVVILTSYDRSNNEQMGMILMASQGTAYWVCCIWPAPFYNTTRANNYMSTSSWIVFSTISSDAGKVILLPLLCADYYSFQSSFANGVGPISLRGMLDGLYFAPLGNNPITSTTYAGVMAHLDTVTVGATTYMIIQPGGTPTGNVHPWTGNYCQGLAIAEV